MVEVFCIPLIHQLSTINPQLMLSCSTCWNSGRHTRGEDMLQEILDLGFERIELGHGIRLSLMDGIQRYHEAGKVQFSTFHNFCPLPIEVTRASPDCYEYSSHRSSEREVIALLDEINAPNVGYWHDFGHIQIKENLGFLDHYEWLSLISPRMFGGHLHDVEWPGHDHRAPFSGSINYERLVPLLPKNCLLVWEMSPRRKADEITESLRKWKARFGTGDDAPATQTTKSE